MATYTQLNLDEAQSILLLYGIRGIKHLTAQQFGISNSNYRVGLNTGDEIILKISNDKSYEQINEEQKILSYLKNHGYPYSLAPFKTEDDKMVYQWKEYTGVILPCINGEIPQITEHNLFQVGAALAGLHTTSEGKEDWSDLRQHTDVGFGISQIISYIYSSQCPDYYKDSFNSCFKKERLDKIINTALPNGIIHGDLYYDNTLFLNSQLVAVLDFEQAGTGEFLFDIGVSISGSCLKDGKIEKNYMESFIKGYQSVRKLTDEEKEFLNDYVLLGLFSISRWRIKRFIENNLDPKKRDNFKELLERALKFKNNE